MHIRGWERRLMGSIPDGLNLPVTSSCQSELREHTWRDYKTQADYDIWMWRPEFSVGFMPTSAPLIADTSGCPPGYGKVKLNTTASAEEIISRYPLNTILTQTLVDCKKLIQYNYNFLMISLFDLNDPNIEIMRHGPAINTCKRNTGLSEDYVPVLICKEWPELGHRWERRQRRSGWPSPEFISDLKKLGCDFVQVPSHNSTNPEVEWRIAFSLIEQKLCQSFTTVQRQCFIIAKLIMKRDLGSCEGYSTYLLKTTMFWMMEDIVLTDWQEENALARFIILLLDKFQSFLKKGELPHYIIEERNLIEPYHKSICEEMIDKIDGVRRSLHIHILLHCYCLFPFQELYSIYKERWFSLFHTTLRYSLDERLNLKQEILRFMVTILAMINNIGQVVDILKQHGHILDPQVHRPASTCGDERTWILQKVDEHYLFPRLSGMLCLYYHLLHRDKSLLRTAFNHFAHVLNHCGTIYDGRNRYTPEHMAQPELYIWQVFALKASGDYQQALDLITSVRNNDQSRNHYKNVKMTIPSEFVRLLDTLLEVNYRNAIYPTVHYISLYLNVQLLVLLDRFSEADSLMEYWRTQAPSFLIPPRNISTEDDHQLFPALAYVWASNFTKAAEVFESIDTDHHGGISNIHALCKAICS